MEYGDERHGARGRPQGADIGLRFLLIACLPIMLPYCTSVTVVSDLAGTASGCDGARRDGKCCRTRPRPSSVRRRIAIRCSRAAGRRRRWASRRTRAARCAWLEARVRAGAQRPVRAAPGTVSEYGRQPVRTATEKEDEEARPELGETAGKGERRAMDYGPYVLMAPATAQLGPRLDEPLARTHTEAVRVGEAANPGPGAGSGGLPLRSRPSEGGLHYPRAHKEGFRCIRAAGFEQDERTSEKATGQFTLTMETVNTTGWGPLKRRLQRS